MKTALVIGFIIFNSTTWAANEKTQAASVNKDRPFAGGKDEQDLVVQQQLIPPTATVDRSSIEQKVLKSNFKKDEAGKYQKQ